MKIIHRETKKTINLKEEEDCDPVTQLQAQSKHDELLEATRRLLEQFEKWEGYHQWDEEDEIALERTRTAIAKVSHPDEP